jgi:hypothetical protein
MEFREYAIKLKENNIDFFPTNDKVPFKGYMWKTKESNINDFDLYENEEIKNTLSLSIKLGQRSQLICIDFDTYKIANGKDFFLDFIRNEFIEFLNQEKRVYIETTQKGGYHFIFKTNILTKNQKLAKVKIDNDKYDCIIESKAEDGYIVTYPTPNYHKISAFELWELQEIDDNEYETIFELVKSYNEEVINESIPFMPGTVYDGKKIWEYYNEEQSSIDYAKQLLEQNGWKINGKKCIRPGKTEGNSATFGHVANNVFYVFSTSCHPFEEGKAYKPFNILTLLEFNGDYKESTKYISSILKNENVNLTKPSLEQKKILEDCFIDFRKDVILPPPIISFINDYGMPYQKNIGVFSMGDISVLTGWQKAKKTFMLNKIVESYLNNGKIIDKYVVSNVPLNKQRVCIIDTEQSEYWANLNAKRINKISNSENFHYLGLRKFNPKERKEKIELYLNNYSENLGLLIIDGIADLCFNTNDMEESINIINWLMNISAEKRVHIMCALHLNPGMSSSGQTKMRGFLGTMLAQKAETVIEIEKDSRNDNQSKISPKDVRGQSFKPFMIEIDEIGLPRFIGLGEVVELEQFTNNKTPF